MQQALDDDRENFYAAADWALDLSAARFHELDLRGIPARLVRLKADEQIVLRRDSMKAAAETLTLKSARLRAGVAWLLDPDNHNDAVFGVPPLGPKSELAAYNYDLTLLRQKRLI